MKNSLFLFPQCNILMELDGSAEPYLSGSYEEFVTALISLYDRPWSVQVCVCVCARARACVFVCADSSSYFFFSDMHATHLFPALYLLGQNTNFS